MRKRRKGKRTGLGIIAIMVLSICGVVSYKRIELNKASERALAKVSELTKAIEKEDEKNEDLKELKAYVQTNKYIEDMARERFGLVYEDEIVFKPHNK